MVFSSSSSIAIASDKFNNDALYFTKKQLMWAIIGLFGMFFAMNIRFNKYKKLYAPFFLLTTVMLVIVLISGAVLNGARSWIHIFGLVSACRVRENCYHSLSLCSYYQKR